jgi:hypothetical protein
MIVDELQCFFAYPSFPSILGETIEDGVQKLRSRQNFLVTTWKASEVLGQFIGEKILDDIASADALIADVTRLNFNVTYEIGFAIGKRKRLLLTKNSSLEPDNDESEFGVFDTIGHRSYQNSFELAVLLREVESIIPIDFATATINALSPVYLLDAKYKTDQVTRIFSRVKKAKLSFRSFDPNEQPRLSALEAIRNVAQSHGVLVHLLSQSIRDARLHNLRAAFVAGLAAGMEKVLTIIQFSQSEPVPLDYRDFAVPCLHPQQIDETVATFATDVAEAFQTKSTILSEPTTFLGQLNLGASAAENELRVLGAYYLETDAYKRARQGDARMVIGRKGSGKTAIFFQVRDRVRQEKKNVVLDLKPDGYQLLKFKESVLKLMNEGTYQHTITAFWEYLILLELCHKLLDNDRRDHTRNSRLYQPYRNLSDAYATDQYVAEGDFSERMSKLIENVSNNYQAKYGLDQRTEVLSSAEVTELLYVHDVARLRHHLEDYLKLKDAVWILFDNLDKGWPAKGIRSEDLIILRCLEDATRKIERQLNAHDVEAHTLLFLRQDVYELLLDEISDRGKQARVTLDWTDADMLREILKRRLVFNGAALSATFLEIWREICVSYVDGEESSQYLIDRCLMRPRYLLNLVNYCRSFAINLGHTKIETEDIEKGVGAYSDELVKEIGYEIRDIAPKLEDVLYVFIDVDSNLAPDTLASLLNEAGFSQELHKQIAETLLWYGVLGIFSAANEGTYIYNVNYNMKVLLGIISREPEFLYVINPAFWKGLAVKTSRR